MKLIKLGLSSTLMFTMRLMASFKDALYKLSKTISPQKLFPYDWITL